MSSRLFNAQWRDSFPPAYQEASRYTLKVSVRDWFRRFHAMDTPEHAAEAIKDAQGRIILREDALRYWRVLLSDYGVRLDVLNAADREYAELLGVELERRASEVRAA